MDNLTDKDQEYLQRVRRCAKYVPTVGWGMIVFAILLAVPAGIKYAQFIAHYREVNNRYKSHIESIQTTTLLEKQLVERLKQEKEFSEGITKMTFILGGVVGALLLGGIISSGGQLLSMGITHRRYLKIIEKIEQKE
jgi:hypothetical protein